MARFTVTTAREPGLDDAEVYVLRDNGSGAEARVAPSLGNNLYSLQVTMRGRPLEVFLQPGPEVRAYGNPILFPFMNRIRHGRFRFRRARCASGINPQGTPSTVLCSGCRGGSRGRAPQTLAHPYGLPASTDFLKSGSNGPGLSS